MKLHDEGFEIQGNWGELGIDRDEIRLTLNLSETAGLLSFSTFPFHVAFPHGLLSSINSLLTERTP